MTDPNGEPATITIAGLRTCDTCRKALAWLKAERIAYQFRDLRADGLDLATVTRWAAAVGWEALLNRRGTTWSRLAASERDGIDEARAIALMVRLPALVRRPVFEHGALVAIGFGPEIRDLLRDAGHDA